MRMSHFPRHNSGLRLLVAPAADAPGVTRHGAEGADKNLGVIDGLLVDFLYIFNVSVVKIT